MPPIRIAIAGVGNCASSLVQGIGFDRAHPGELAGLMHERIGEFRVGDIEVVAAFDVDARKVGRSVAEAIFALPNNTKRFSESTQFEDVSVQMGPVLDGIAEHLKDYPADRRPVVSDASAVDVAKSLRDSRAEILVNFMPVGAQRATEHYAQACLDAGASFINCVPCFVASDSTWAKKFERAGLACIGDDVKAQLGATITHRALAKLCADRGVKILRTYQLNTGGNTDFLNMLSRDRLASKKISKTDAVQSALPQPLDDSNIHIGPSDYVPFLKDNKVCYLRIEGVGFGGVPVEMEVRLSVEDSPNSAGVVVDAIRCCKLARDAKLAGPIDEVCAWLMKHPPRQMSDDDARRAVDAFIATHSGRPSSR